MADQDLVQVLSQGTLVPLSVVASLLGGMVWIGSIAGMVRAHQREIEQIKAVLQINTQLSVATHSNEREINSLKVAVDRRDDKLDKILERLASLEGMLERFRGNI